MNTINLLTSAAGLAFAAAAFEAGIVRMDEQHDPSGRECALAGRHADDVTVTGYCVPCYLNILEEQGMTRSDAQSVMDAE